ncbi:hypothetical protein PIB30_116119, partial [Stylosanthes scabra]|nr:hypothetical protein [Stylosanthes scabra]
APHPNRRLSKPLRPEGQELALPRRLVGIPVAVLLPLRLQPPQKNGSPLAHLHPSPFQLGG